ncbi:MAG: hypothetical protein WCJ35_12255 [Planctomycetota bacterium]
MKTPPLHYRIAGERINSCFGGGRKGACAKRRNLLDVLPGMVAAIQTHGTPALAIPTSTPW